VLGKDILKGKILMVQKTKQKKNRNLNGRLSVNESDCKQLLVYAFMS